MKKEAKVTMPTLTAQMPTRPSTYCQKVVTKRQIERNCKDGFSLLEITIVLGILSLLTAVVTMNFGSKVGKSSFKREAMEIVNALKIAQNGAAQSNIRYAIEFDFVEQTYTLQEIRTLEELYDATLLEPDMIMSTTQLSDRCRIEFVLFDDGNDTREEAEIDDSVDLRTHFVAGRSGWRNGGKIGLTDIDGNPYSIIINRMSKSIILEEGDIDTYFLEPKDNLQF